MSESDEYESLFHEHLGFIDKVTALTARQLGFRDADADDFAAWARERLWEQNYLILRKWRGESRLTTYLTTVIVNLGREFRVKLWGRWRHSAASRRLGPLAMRLEELVYRDGLTRDEAIQLLRLRGETTGTDRELTALFAQIPERSRPRRVGDQEVPIETVPGADDPHERVLKQEAAETRSKVSHLLWTALSRLTSEQQIVIRMHYLEGRSIADVARALGVEQKPLYGLRDGALAGLRRQLLAAGMTYEQLHDVIGGMDALEPPPGPDTDDSRPSNESCDSSPEDDQTGPSDSAPPERTEP